MKNIRKIIVLVLVLTMVVGQASAFDTSTSEDICTPMDEEWDTYADSFKITFERESVPELSTDSMSRNSSSVDYDEAQKTIALEHNARVAEQAKEFVRSLNLSEKNFGYIEEFCLAELDYYSTMEDAQLISYTVHTPKQNSGVNRSSPSESDLMYFGTYQARDFYFFYPSEAETTTNVKRQSTKSVLQNWAKALLGVLLSYNGGGSETVSVTTLWSDIMSISSLPQNYVVKDNAYAESYCDVVVHTRGIYTQFGNGDYEMLTSQQFGEVYPFVNFYPVDRPTYPGCISYDYGYEGIVTSPRYNAGTSALCQEAWQKFYGSLVLPDTLLLSSLKTYWR